MIQAQVEKSANEAIFQLQLDTSDAVRYVVRNAKVDDKIALATVKKTLTFHKKK